MTWNNETNQELEDKFRVITRVQDCRGLEPIQGVRRQFCYHEYFFGSLKNIIAYNETGHRSIYRDRFTGKVNQVE